MASKTPRIDSAIGAANVTIGIDVHGSIPSDIEFVEVPANLVIIELGLPNQYTYAEYYIYMYAIFIKPILLNYLYDNDYDNKSLYKLSDLLQNHGHIDVSIYTNERGNLIQKYLLHGKFEELSSDPFPAKSLDFDKKLEILEVVIKSLTIYKEGDSIISRFISAYENPLIQPVVIDDTCHVDISQGDNSIILNKQTHPGDLIVIGNEPPKRLLDSLSSLKDIFTYFTGKNGKYEKDGTSTIKIIENIANIDTSVKLIIFTCSRNDKMTDNKEIHKLITHVMNIRNEFHQERSNNSGPNNAAKGHLIPVNYAYTSGKWCISDKKLTYITEEFAKNNAENHDKDEDEEEGIVKNANENNANQNDEENHVYCSIGEYTHVSCFIYVDLQNSIDKIETDKTIHLTNTIVSNPFLKLTFIDVLSSEFPLYNILYIISKEYMTIYKMSHIFSDYITSDEITNNRTDKVHIFLLNIYASFAAEYILKPFQIPEGPEEDKTKKRVMSFKEFSDLTKVYVEDLMKVTKLNTELQSIVFKRSERTFDATYMKTYKDYYTKYLTHLPILKVDSTAADISNFIDSYRTYLHTAFEALIYISTISNPDFKIRKEQLSLWEKQNIDLVKSDNNIKNYFIDSYKLIRNTLIKAYITPSPAEVPVTLTGKTKRGSRRKNRKVRKTRRKNRKV